MFDIDLLGWAVIMENEKYMRCMGVICGSAVGKHEQGKPSNSGSGPVVLYFGPFSKRVDGGLVY